MPKEIGNLTLYSVNDLHRQLGLSKMTIRTYLREGKIRARKLGVHWYVTEQALRDYFNEPPPSDTADKYKTNGSLRYVVKGMNDLVSEQEACDTVEDTVECLKNQAIISLFQVEIIDRETNEVFKLMKGRDFLDQHA